MERLDVATKCCVNLRTLIVGLLLSPVVMGDAAARADTGVIRGLVVNGSLDQRPIQGAQVVLRARIQGAFTVVEATTTDSGGRFQFAELPVDGEIQYSPGAIQGEVLYPGPRLSLSTQNASAEVRIVAYEASTEPSPLVVQQHDITVRITADATEVTESMVIENRSKFCYVGQATDKPDRVVTLQLSIPPEFEKVTFEKEFFGRRFSLIDGKLLTGIPWPPGERRLEFTYAMPIDRKFPVWRRVVDLPCSKVNLTVHTKEPDNVRCNLKSERSVSDAMATFATTGGTLPAGHEIRLQVGRVPVPWRVYGRWVASGLLVTLIGGTSAVLRRRQRGDRGSQPTGG
jgi:hypothetical protein